MNLKPVIAAALISLACGSALAQGDAAKKELASKLVTQQTADLDQLSAQLTNNAVTPMLAKWAPRLQTEVSEARRKEVADKLNEELNKLREDTYAIIKGKIGKASSEALTPLYLDKFSEDELKQLTVIFDSPVFKKLQAAAPELQNALIQKVVEASRSEVQARTAAFDASATKLIPGESAKKGAPKKK
ncbi:MAG: DUF2059 domain-containing protein [Burkholderiales bacterium]